MAVLLCEAKAVQNPGMGAEDVHFLTALGAQAPLETWGDYQEMGESCDKSARQLNLKQTKNLSNFLIFSLITASVFHLKDK